MANSMAFDQGDEVVLRVAAERGLAKMRVGGKKALRRYFKIGEIAAAAARDENLGARLIVMLEQQHAPAAIPGRHRAHEPGRSGADDHHVKRFHRRGNYARDDIAAQGRPAGENADCGLNLIAQSSSSRAQQR